MRSIFFEGEQGNVSLSLPAVDSNVYKVYNCGFRDGIRDRVSGRVPVSKVASQ